jgi:MFS family permease
VVLCCNVTAGIGILERAAPIYTDFFPRGSGLTGVGLTAAAAGFVAMLSLANMLGRFIWSSTSDVLGRKNIYRMYLGVGALLYLAVTLTTNANKVVSWCVACSSCRSTARDSPRSLPTCVTYSVPTRSAPSTVGCSRRGRSQVCSAR